MQRPSVSPARLAKQNGRGIGFLWLATALGWAIWMLILGTEVNPQGNWLTNLLGNRVVHAGSFLVGGMLWIHSLRRVGRLRVITAIASGSIISFVFGVIIEGIQRNIPTREADPGDLVANLVGILLAIGLYVFATRSSSQK